MRYLVFLLTLVMVLSCKEKLIDPPEDLIPQEKMTEILYDLAIIKGLQSTNGSTILQKYDIETMPYIYDKYGVDSLRFVTSDQYYASIPTIYQTMYQSIHERLEENIQKIDAAREQKNDSLRTRNQKIRDSLTKKGELTKSPVPSSK